MVAALVIGFVAVILMLAIGLVAIRRMTAIRLMIVGFVLTIIRLMVI